MIPSTIKKRYESNWEKMRAGFHPLDLTYAFDIGWRTRWFSVMNIHDVYIFLDV